MTTETLTLTDFLLARIAEDEEEIRSFGTPAPMEEGPIPYPRLLAQCEADRALITVLSDVEWTGSYAVRDVSLGILAVPYADHPDYREEWRP